MSASFARHFASASTVLALTVALGGCGGDDKRGEFYTSWDLAGGCASGEGAVTRHDADGRPRDVCDLGAARWVWVTYAAGWCQTSRRQARALHRLRRAAIPGLEIVLVLTSGDDTFVPADRGDARAWAATYGLPRSRVLYDEEHDSRVIPQHLLIGPDGHTWYRYVGFLQLDEMQQLLDDFASARRMPDVRGLAGR